MSGLEQSVQLDFRPQSSVVESVYSQYGEEHNTTSRNPRSG